MGMTTMNEELLNSPEWLEADGLGGFASGTACGARTRRYHALLLAAMRPPCDRWVLVNGLDAWVETNQGAYDLSSQFYEPGVLHPAGMRHAESFQAEPWPTWAYRLENGTRVQQEIFVIHGRPLAVVAWKLLEPTGQAILHVRPFLSARDHHQLHYENDKFNFDARVGRTSILWRPYAGAPGIVGRSNGRYRHDPQWYRQFRYEHEVERGLDAVEDLASPGELIWNLGAAPAFLMFAPDSEPPVADDSVAALEEAFAELREQEEARRARFASPQARAADAYLATRDAGRTILAGYPWFSDWGRDAFAALRGLCLATGRLPEARATLLAWADKLSVGMIPNRFVEDGQPEYDSVDASLWFVVTAGEYLMAAQAAALPTLTADEKRLSAAVHAILANYRDGTRHGIRLDADGLLAAGVVGGAPLTWMDAKVGAWIVTPRVGKPVEIQALWLNALRVGSRWDAATWEPLFEKGLRAFRERFWDEGRGVLCDVVDMDHEPGRLDLSMRPNQILAVGGLPCALLEGEQARRVVQAVEDRLWTPLGLRTLDPADPSYRPRSVGSVVERDAAYHQGAAWPWLLGPFVEAWTRVHGGDAAARREARERFLTPLFEHLKVAGLGHVSEVADAEPPFTPRGCPFQAWSLGELLRLDLQVLAEPGAKKTE
jgi:predicted glycogen debranching enzyme